MKDLKHIKRFNESDENLNISDVMNSINENVLVGELESSLKKIDKIKELIEREIGKNKRVQYSDKRNKKLYDSFRKRCESLSTKICNAQRLQLDYSCLYIGHNWTWNLAHIYFSYKSNRDNFRDRSWKKGF